MFETLNGAMRLYPIVGDPIAQVKSPAGVSQGFAERNVNAICIPLHVTAADLSAFIEGFSRAHNVDGSDHDHSAQVRCLWPVCDGDPARPRSWRGECDAP